MSDDHSTDCGIVSVLIVEDRGPAGINFNNHSATSERFRSTRECRGTPSGWLSSITSGATQEVVSEEEHMLILAFGTSGLSQSKYVALSILDVNLSLCVAVNCEDCLSSHDTMFIASTNLGNHTQLEGAADLLRAGSRATVGAALAAARAGVATTVIARLWRTNFSDVGAAPSVTSGLARALALASSCFGTVIIEGVGAFATTVIATHWTHDGIVALLNARRQTTGVFSVNNINIETGGTAAGRTSTTVANHVSNLKGVLVKLEKNRAV